MRKRRFSYVGALGLALAVAIPGTALAGTGTQRVDAGFSPQKNANISLPSGPVNLDDKKFSKNGTLRTRLFVENISPPPPVATATIDIHVDQDVKFTTKRLDECDPAELSGLGEDAALDACGDALIGRGSALAFPLTTAGTKQNGNPTVLFDSLAPIPGLVIVSEMQNSELPGFKTKFHSLVANAAGGPVPDGTPIIDTDFTNSKNYKDKKLVKKSKKLKKKSKKAKKQGNKKKAKKLKKKSKKTKKKSKKSWTQARCSDGQLETRVDWTHVSDPPQSDTDVQQCTG